MKALRTQHGLTQRELARRARLSQGYVARLEARHYKTNPSLAVMRRLAAALGVGLMALIEPSPRRKRS